MDLAQIRHALYKDCSINLLSTGQALLPSVLSCKLDGDPMARQRVVRVHCHVQPARPIVTKQCTHTE